MSDIKLDDFPIGRVWDRGLDKDASLVVTVDVSLKEKEKGKTFSMSASVWNRRQSDIYCGGQMLEGVAEYLDKGQFKELFVDEADLRRLIEIWRKHHLNDLTAECMHQVPLKDYLRRVNPEMFGHWNYDEMLVIPEFKECPVCGYAYGSAWNLRPIPESVITEIKEISGRFQGSELEPKGDK